MNEMVDQYIKIFYKEDTSGHDYAHSKRVEHLALKIASKEKFEDLEYISLIALLHDIDDHKFTKHKGKYINTRKILKEQGCSESFIERICSDISQISFSQNKGKKPNTLASQIVQDADRLDAIGAIGLSRCIMYSASHSRPLYYSVDLNEEDEITHKTTIGHYYEKLNKLIGLMNTETAKHYALKRNRTMKNFVNQLRSELND